MAKKKNVFSFVLRLLLPSVVTAFAMAKDELKETTPDHFDKVLDWNQENVFEELSEIYTDNDEDNKTQLANWYKEKRAPFLYVTANAVVEEGKILTKDRLPEDSVAAQIIIEQLETLQKQLVFLSTTVGTKEEMAVAFEEFIKSEKA